MNAATPRAAIEGGKVRPDRRLMKPPRFHRRDQACGGSGFPLHVTDAPASLSPMMEGEQDAEFESADSGAEREDVAHSPSTGRHCGGR